MLIKGRLYGSGGAENQHVVWGDGVETPKILRLWCAWKPQNHAVLRQTLENSPLDGNHAANERINGLEAAKIARNQLDVGAL